MIGLVRFDCDEYASVGSRPARMLSQVDAGHRDSLLSSPHGLHDTGGCALRMIAVEIMPPPQIIADTILPGNPKP